MEKFKNIVFNTPRNKCCGDLLGSSRRGDSYKCPNDLFLEVKDSVLDLILPLLRFFIQRQIVYNLKQLGNKHCLYNVGPL